MSRRSFVKTVTAGTPLALAGMIPGLTPLLTACDSGAGPEADPDGATGLNPLRLASVANPQGLTLTAAPGTAGFGGGVRGSAWMLNGQLPSPLIRVRRGEPFRVSMVNQLPQHLILHWHGLTPPVEMDGHPRFAVPPGGRYEYDFTVRDRAGTYWYHSHAHMHTSEHTFRGIAGLLIVDDAEEAGLGLPSGARELPLILQDRPVDAAGVPVFSPQGPVMMAGIMGPAPFVNGIHRPFVEVDAALYRLRVLNGSNARIFRLGRSDGRPLILIGTDGGLLERPLSLGSMDLAPAERADILLDLREARVGERLILASLPFAVPGGMGFMGGANLQGDPMDLLEFRVARRVSDSASVPASLSAPILPDPSAAVRERTFRFTSEMMQHRINGREFDMERIDERVPFGQTELWAFVNDSTLPHPVHLHATHFRVVSRSGGRGAVMPWEAGLKDTVLVLPGETVRVAVRFTEERGLYLLHCHNLEHEDMGMMANILIE